MKHNQPSQIRDANPKNSSGRSCVAPPWGWQWMAVASSTRGAATLEVLSGQVKELQDSMTTLHNITKYKHEVLAGLQPAGCLDQGCFRKKCQGSSSPQTITLSHLPTGTPATLPKRKSLLLSESRVTAEHHGKDEEAQVVFSVPRARRESISS